MAKTRRPMPALPAELRSRPPLERMLRIHELLKDGRTPGVGELARRLEVSGKTVQRDVEFMRERLKLPVSYSRTHSGYRYTEPVAGFPSLQVTEGEVVALLVAQEGPGAVPWPVLRGHASFGVREAHGVDVRRVRLFPGCGSVVPPRGRFDSRPRRLRDLALGGAASPGSEVRLPEAEVGGRRGTARAAAPPSVRPGAMGAFRRCDPTGSGRNLQPGREIRQRSTAGFDPRAEGRPRAASPVAPSLSDVPFASGPLHVSA